MRWNAGEVSGYINNNIWHLHSLSIDENQTVMCGKFECREDIHYKTQTYNIFNPCSKPNIVNLYSGDLYELSL